MTRPAAVNQTLARPTPWSVEWEASGRSVLRATTLPDEGSLAAADS